jgi:hypothetical protein
MPIRVLPVPPTAPRDRLIDYLRALLDTHPGDLPRAAIEAALNDLEN